MDRRSFIGISGAGVLGAMAGSALNLNGQETAPAELSLGESGEGRGSLHKRPNIVLFMPDEMRADALACYDNPVTKTPNFDRLASQGTRFANCHVQFPVCGASRCSLLTGWPTSVRGHRSLFYFLRPDEPNLFRYLKQSGYDVFWFGKNDALAAQSFYDSVTYWDRGSSHERPTHPITPNITSMLHGKGGDRRDDLDYSIVRSAIEIIERKESDRPFCLFLPMQGSHPPYTTPANFYSMYSPDSVGKLVPPDLPKKPDYQKEMRRHYNLDRMTDHQLREVRAVYYGKVSYSDWLMGEVLEALEKNGRDKDTAVMLFSDHGDYAGDYGLTEKWPSGLEDCLTHVPLIMRAPGGKSGHTVNEMTELYDVMASCLGLAGVQARHTHFARDLAPQLNGAAGDAGRAAFAEGGYNIYEPQCFEPITKSVNEYSPKVTLENKMPETVSRSAMVRTRTHKLIWRSQGQKELYDVAADPGLTRNLIDESSSAAVKADLQVRLMEHFINTSGIAPMDKDSRSSPPFYPTRSDIPATGWQGQILDQG
jgi:choline-sulfatase